MTYDRFASFLILKTPSQEKHKTSFGIQTTIVLNLLVELTKPCKRPALYIYFNRFFYKPRAMSFKLQGASFKLQAMNYTLQATGYKLREMKYKIAPTTADDSTVQPCTMVGLYGPDLHCTLIELS
jgi:hypothetical protein